MKQIIILIFIAALLAGLLITLPEKPSENQIKRFSSYDQLRSFLKTNLESYAYPTLFGGRATALETTAPAQEKSTAEDYSTTNIQVAGVDEADIVKNDGEYIYVASGNQIVIIDAYPAEEMRILSTIKFDGNPSEIFVNKNKLVVFADQFQYYALKGDIAIGSPIWYYSPKTSIYVYDISDRTNPSLTRNITVDGNYVDSRMIGDYAYAVINSPINDVENIALPVVAQNGEDKTIPANEIFYFDVPDYSYQFTNIISLNTQNDQEDYSSKTILMGYTQNIFVSLDNIYITYQKIFSYREFQDRLIEEALLPNLPFTVRNEINQIINSDLAGFEKEQKISEVLENYFNTLSEKERAILEKAITEKMFDIEIEIQKEMQKTVVHRIAIENGNIEYEANGEVPGTVLNQFSMDEYNGYFRIATTTQDLSGFVVASRTAAVEASAVGSESVQVQAVQIEKPVEETEVTPSEVIIEPPRRPSSSNNIYILDSSLNIVGETENLAAGESIFSARFLGDRAYLVTFRRIDPLFVIDLSDPTNPKVLGQLKIPGFSDYLHPYDENHIIGIGKEVSEGEFPLMQGVKLGLFDVTDPANPKEIAKYEIGTRGTDSEALRDHKAFLFSRQKNLLFIPILLTEKTAEDFWGGYVWQGAYVFDITLENGFVEKGRVTHVPSNESVEYYFFSPYSVKRSLYIDNVLYTVSDGMIKANSLVDLSEISSVELPFVQEPIPLVG